MCKCNYHHLILCYKFCKDELNIKKFQIIFQFLMNYFEIEKINYFHQKKKYFLFV